jgi:hypothetical protein
MTEGREAASKRSGTVSFERDGALIWLDPRVVNKLRAQRRPGENDSDVIVRLVEIEAEARQGVSPSAYVNAARR